MKTKLNAITFLSVALLAGATASAADGRSDQSVERKGTVTQVLMNPEGDADGLLLDNGTQVKFPPHLSKDLRAAVAAKDSVTVKGFEERGKVVRAETITNTKSGKTVTDVPPNDDPAKMPPPPPGHRSRGPLENREGLAELSVKGKITTQLFGPRGDVNGVILSTGAIVHVGPRALDMSKASLDIGKQIQATGYGTKNEFGQSIEATELKNL